MIGVVQAQATASLLELMGSQAFERSLGCNRHEDGQRNRAMGQLESSSTCLGDLDGASVFIYLVVCIYSGHPEHRATGWYVRAECILPTTAATACLMDAMVIECRLRTRGVVSRKKDPGESRSCPG